MALGERLRSSIETTRRAAEHPALRPLLQVARGFTAHRGPVRAASLAFTTLLALVPLVALVLGISKALIRSQDNAVLDQWVDRALSAAVPQLQYLSEANANDARADVVARLQEAIGRIDAGALGFFGSLVLVSVAVSLFSAIEHALNDIWGVERGRGLAQRIVYYWAGVTLGPILLFVSLGLTGSAAIDNALAWLPGGIASRAFWFGFPFAVLGIGFTLLYWTMPNTSVPLRAAAIGGFAAGILFQANNLLSVLYFSRVMGYSAVYGSLGAVPVLMLGIYVSWMIVLLGAEVSHVAASPIREEPVVPQAFDDRAAIALAVARSTAAAYLAGRGGATRDEIAAELAIAPAWINAALELLCQSGLLTGGDAKPEDDGPRYLPAMPPAAIAGLDVIRAARKAGTPDVAFDMTTAPAPVREFLQRFDAALADDLASVTLETLATSASPPWGEAAQSAGEGETPRSAPRHPEPSAPTSPQRER